MTTNQKKPDSSTTAEKESDSVNYVDQKKTQQLVYKFIPKVNVQLEMKNIICLSI
jgi:hypothetical protein